MKSAPIELVDVRKLASEAEQVVASFERDHADLLAQTEVHHIGATSLPFGHTKGDVDVNVRVAEARFSELVTALRGRLAVAQPDNWTPTFASFSADGYSLPLGVQVTVIGSDSDFLLELRDRLRADPDALRRYNEAKLGAASSGGESYWRAKDRLLRDLLAGKGDTRSQRERMLAGDLYLADDPELAAESRRAAALMSALNAPSLVDAAERKRILEELLGSLGEDTEIRPPFYCDYGYNTHIGAGTFVNYGLVALDVARIEIGDDVQVGPRVQLLTPTHPVDPELRRTKWEAAEPITIGDNVWLGGGAIVCPGVTIGADTVVGAGAVVTRDLPARVVAVGSPARVIRTL